MSTRYLSRDEVRAFDRWAIEIGIPGPVLMQSAAEGVLRVLLAQDVVGPVVILAGKGNNGGDGFVLARLLAVYSIPTAVYLATPEEEIRGDAAIAMAPLRPLGIPVEPLPETLAERLDQAEWIIDALLGIGAVGSPKGEYARAIEAANRSGRRILAIDIPSGMDADTGQAAHPTIRAEHTVTFVALKQGFAHPSARNYTGKIHVVPIGVPLPGGAGWGSIPARQG